MRRDRQLIKEAFKSLAIILLVMVASRYTKSVALFGVVLYGIWAAFSHKVGTTFFCYMLLNLCVLSNPFILPKSGFIFTLAVRGGCFFIGLALTMEGVRRAGRYRLPFGLLWAYLGVMMLSSATGWYPKVSYLKLIQFSVFLLSLSVGLQNLENCERDVWTMRKCMLGISLFVIGGSFLLWPFPQYSSLKAVAWYGDAALVDVQAQAVAEAGANLLCGSLFQSQALSAVDACLTGWLICDMLFVEKRTTFFHLVLISLGVFILALTRSRTGLFAFCVAVGMLITYLMPRIRLPIRVKARVQHLILLGAVVLGAVMLIAELRDNTITKLVRKKDDLAADDRSLTEAVTSSRMGLIEKSTRDFKLNPLWGMGFQVEERHRYHIKGHTGGFFIFSASIEKGLLPVMVLGEGGLVGALVFASFLLVFYVVCTQRRLLITATLFAVFLGTNMGEATFFSPGGPGGLEWLVSVAGGFAIDMILLNERRAVNRYSIHYLSR